MAKDRSLVRASDIGAWAYCGRAWFLAQVKGVAHQRPEALVAGTAAHRRHGRRVAQATRAQRIGWWLAGIGALLAALMLMLLMLSLYRS
ncbi:MAG TPA: hypothetical protein VNK95_12720 [Caldilineaceae bacterium]|nr:hypothetical protein [Caldilineaceae bacterium]